MARSIMLAVAIAFFALLAISQAAPSAIISTDESAALEMASPNVCINVPFGVGQVYVCPTPGNCDRVYVVVFWPVFVHVDVVTCKRPGGGS